MELLTRALGSERSPQRIEQRAIAVRAAGVAPDRLADLRCALGPDAPFAPVELEATRIEGDVAEVEQRPDRSLGLGDERFVNDRLHSARQACLPERHQPLVPLEAGRDVVDRIAPGLALREPLPVAR